MNDYYRECIEDALSDNDIKTALEYVEEMDYGKGLGYAQIGDYFYLEMDDEENAFLYYNKAIKMFENEPVRRVARPVARPGYRPAPRPIARPVTDEETEEDISSCYVSLANIEIDRNDLTNARKHLLLSWLHDPDTVVEEEDGKIRNLKDILRTRFESINEEYTKKFLELPSVERKYLLVTDSINDLNQSHFATLDMKSDLSHLSFPFGHPQVNELYVAHPLVTNRYIPIEDYQLEMIEDKVRELCELAQSLGAERIDIDCLNSSSSERTNNRETNVSGGVSRKIVSANASYHNEASNRLLERLSRSISLHQEFQPCKAPFVPDNLIWYKSEPNWQRLRRQRLEGGLVTHEERIETSKCRAGSSHEMNSVKAELKALFTKIDVEFDQTYETKFEQMEDAVLAIKIKFAPLSELTGSGTTRISKNTNLSANVQRYLNEVKECFVDGEISKTGRKLLNRMREQLGISEARAAELEASVVAPKLTDDEKEYLETYREACTDGKISDGERRMLDRYRSKLGISESRAKEIERMA